MSSSKVLKGGLCGKRTCGFPKSPPPPPGGWFSNSKSGCLPSNMNFTSLLEETHTTGLQAEELLEFLLFSSILRKTSPPTQTHKYSSNAKDLSWEIRQAQWSPPLPILAVPAGSVALTSQDAGCLEWNKLGASMKFCSCATSRDNLF